MLFNSLEFLVFLPVVFALYWSLARFPRWQNLLVVVASYVFYGWWDWRFLGLIAFTSAWSYAAGVLDGRCNPRQKRILLASSLVVNLGILGTFKYYNFFVESALAVLGTLGFDPHPAFIQIALPVGISFYTFQALSYSIDVCRGAIKPTRDPVAFFAFISFFPQLVAGPIERATNLLPQFLSPRKFDCALAVEGCRQVLWGFFKKIVIADSCAAAANSLLGMDRPSCISLWVGMVMFAIQIYGDFSGYSDIAIGCGKLFGVRLMRNFAAPYFSRDIAEFWRRWHISLTTWFRDYVYIPLGGSRCGTARKVRNTFVVFLVSGLWHGANWTFVVWGLFHACLFLPLLLLKQNRKYVGNVVAEGRYLPTFGELWRMASTFFLVVVGWTFFRAPDISTAGRWISKMFSLSDWRLSGTGLGHVGTDVLAVLAAFFLVEWFNRDREIPRLPRNKALRILVYYGLIFVILYWTSAPQSFIYFQF